MSDKLNQSLDDILSQRRTNPRSARPRRVAKGGAKPAAPVGGIKKNTRQPKTTTKASNAAAAGIAPKVNGESKIIVSNLVSPNRASSLRTELTCLSASRCQ
jgi:THO complex subunit 4